VDANLPGYDGGEAHPGMAAQVWRRRDPRNGFVVSHGAPGATPEAQNSTMANLCAMIDSFAMTGSSKASLTRIGLDWEY
jgi:hypothetical protein